MTVCSFAEFFGATFRRLRKEAGLSQQDVAAKGGFDRSYVTLIELGKKNPTMTVTEKMASIVSPSVHDFLTSLNADILTECKARRGSGRCPMMNAGETGVCTASGHHVTSANASSDPV
jgi:transcriptional regulator with XRE-family HTH domain